MTPRLVSAVVTNHNYGRFVGRAVESLLSQSIGDALEVIVIDDASTDESWEVLQQYRVDTRVELVQHSVNKGYVYSYNEGIRRSRGRFIVSVDADDFAIDQEALAAQALALDRTPTAGLLTTDHVIVDDSGNALGFRRARVPARMSSREAFRRLLIRNFVTHSGSMIRRDCIEQLGVHDPKFFHNMDLELWLRIASRWEVLYIARPLYAYRLHARSMHRTVDAETALGALRDLLERAQTYSPLPDMKGAARASLARGHLDRATLLFSIGRIRSGLADVRAAFRLRPTSTMSIDGRGAMIQLLLRILLGPRNRAVTHTLRRWLYRRHAQN